MKKIFIIVFAITLLAIGVGCSKQKEIPLDKPETEVQEESPKDTSPVKEDDLEEEPTPEDKATTEEDALEAARVFGDENEPDTIGHYFSKEGIYKVRDAQNPNFEYVVETDADGNSTDYYIDKEPDFYYCNIRQNRDGLLFLLNNTTEDINLQSPGHFHIERKEGDKWVHTGYEDKMLSEYVFISDSGTGVVDGVGLRDFSFTEGEYKIVKKFVNEYDPYDTYYGNIYFRVKKNGVFVDYVSEFIPGDFTSSDLWG